MHLRPIFGEFRWYIDPLSKQRGVPSENLRGPARADESCLLLVVVALTDPEDTQAGERLTESEFSNRWWCAGVAIILPDDRSMACGADENRMMEMECSDMTCSHGDARLLQRGMVRQRHQVARPFVRSEARFEQMHRAPIRSYVTRRAVGEIPILMALITTVLLSIHCSSSGRVLAAAENKSDTQSLPQGAISRLGSDAFSTNGSVSSLAFSPDGKLIAVAENNTPTPYATFMDAESGERQHVLYCDPSVQGSVTCLAFSPDQELFVTGEQSGTLTFFSLAKKFATFRRKLHERAIQDVAFSADGSLIATAGEDGKVHVVRAETFEVMQSISAAAPPSLEGIGAYESGTLGVNFVVFSPDASKLVAGVGATGEVLVWDRQTGEIIRRIDPADYEDAYSEGPESGKLGLRPAKILKDGQILVTAGNSTVPRTQTKIPLGPTNVNLTRIQFWDLESGNHLRDLNDPEDYGFGRVAVSPDESLIAVADFGRLTIRRVDDGRVQQVFSLPGSWGEQPVFSPDGRLVAMSLHNSIGLFDVHAGVQLRADPRIPRGAVYSANWSPDGAKVITGHKDGYLRVWNASNGDVEWVEQLAPVVSPSGSSARVDFVEFTPDGTRLIAAGTRDDPVNWEQGIVVVFDSLTGERLHEQITKQRMETAALSPDGRTLVAAASDGSLGDTHLHGIDVQTGERRFVNPAEDVRVGLWEAAGIQFSPDSSAFFVATGDSHLMRYETDSGKLVLDISIDRRTPQQQRANSPKIPQLWEAAFSSKGDILASSSAEYVYVWNTSTGEKTLQIRHPHDHGCRLAVSPDGKVIVTSDLKYVGDYGEDILRFFDAQTGAELGTLDAAGQRAFRLAYSPDGTKLVTGFYSGSSLVWDVTAIRLRSER